MKDFPNSSAAAEQATTQSAQADAPVSGITHIDPRITDDIDEASGTRHLTVDISGPNDLLTRRAVTEKVVEVAQEITDGLNELGLSKEAGTIRAFTLTLLLALDDMESSFDLARVFSASPIFGSVK